MRVSGVLSALILAACVAQAETDGTQTNAGYTAAIERAVGRVSGMQKAGLRTEMEAAISNWDQVAAFAEVRRLANERCPSCESVRLESDGAWAPYRVTWVLFEGDTGVVYANRQDPAVIETIPLDADAASRRRALMVQVDQAFQECASDVTVTDSRTHVVTVNHLGEERSEAVYGLQLGSRAEAQHKAELIECRELVEALLDVPTQER